jgi:hypothetical protein
MEFRRILLAIAFVAGLAALGACSLFYPSETLRYRMTVTVDTPEGPRTGSSVVESTMAAGPRPGDTGGIHYGLKGEAVAVPLPNGKVLFALLRSNTGGDAAGYHARLMQSAACREGRPSVRPDPSLCGGPDWKLFRPWARKQQLAVELAPSQYPMFVTFGDLADPKSVRSASPAEFASGFGPGYVLRRVSVQVTDDPVTTGIEGRLAWLPQVQGAIVPLSVREYPPPGTRLPLHNTLTSMNFKWSD